ncbi:unnamed protein product [Orchesella dallaii]|uniref:Secreted protein n=1 Tax=Orchesella dallaii TaxID=48710 RepID=A0ABP1PU27_9HEXA
MALNPSKHFVLATTLVFMVALEFVDSNAWMACDLLCGRYMENELTSRVAPALSFSRPPPPPPLRPLPPRAESTKPIYKPSRPRPHRPIRPAFGRLPPPRIRG